MVSKGKFIWEGLAIESFSLFEEFPNTLGCNLSAYTGIHKKEQLPQWLNRWPI